MTPTGDAGVADAGQNLASQYGRSPAKVTATSRRTAALDRRLLAPAREGDRDEPADRGLGPQAAGSREGMEAVACELVRRYIIPHGAGSCGLGQQASDHVMDLVLRSGDLLVSMQERREFGVVVNAGLAGDEGVCLEHCFESLTSVAGLVPDLTEILEDDDQSVGPVGWHIDAELAAVT